MELLEISCYTKKLSQDNLPYSRSFSLIALLKNQLHNPLCARFYSNAIKKILRTIGKLFHNSP